MKCSEAWCEKMGDDCLWRGVGSECPKIEISKILAELRASIERARCKVTE